MGMLCARLRGPGRAGTAGSERAGPARSGVGATPPLRDPVEGPRPPWTRGCSTETRPADADGRWSLVQRCAGKVLPGRCWLGRTARCSVRGGSASELQEHFPRPPATLPTPPCGVGVCPSGCACLRLGVSSCACSCVSDVFCVCVSVRDSPLGVIGSLGVSSRLGRSVCALGVGVFERPLRVLLSEYRCVWIPLSSSPCIFGFCVCLFPLCACLCILRVCACFLSVPLFYRPLCLSMSSTCLRVSLSGWVCTLVCVI